MDLLFLDVGCAGLAMTLNRIGAGAFFMLFNAERHRAIAMSSRRLVCRQSASINGGCRRWSSQTTALSELEGPRIREIDMFGTPQDTDYGRRRFLAVAATSLAAAQFELMGLEGDANGA